jgi:hypothetical protein
MFAYFWYFQYNTFGFTNKTWYNDSMSNFYHHYRAIWLFLSALFGLIVLFEVVWPHSVQFYLNPDIILIFWLIFGILYLYSQNFKDDHK